MELRRITSKYVIQRLMGRFARMPQAQCRMKACAAARDLGDLKECGREVSDNGAFVAGNVAGVAVEESP